MKLRIDVLRHGESTLSHTLRGSTDDVLTALGQMQMQNTVDAFLTQSAAPIVWQSIFSSPLQRCRLFSQQLSTQYDKPLILEKDLQEMHFGDWEAKPTQWIYENFPEQLSQFWQTPTAFTPPNAESIWQFQSRVLNAMDSIQMQMLEKHWHQVLLVTHGGVIKLLKCLATQQSLDNILTMSAELGTLHSFELDTTKQKISLWSACSENKSI
ncbi:MULTISPECIES: histidine phosphatase family protein [unclassified Acinetobacter]|uniref:histidine phosphatase family protein n=1 Tax=unclassified Acinetobacter TaxID=196816 RepID=UPI00257566FE|nr:MULTISPECIES: histidine phosphatase family protein [unclassified Acinetobacter]MDM1765445.1 histidine phosphatase family protein [Acinetobacter sp. 226-1]MDM1768950.1 histidine phosphatase family protein [Acinetobacter sp. 226-4]